MYKEDRVKVYGITERTGLCLIVLCFPVSQIQEWGQRISELESRLKRFELCTYHAGKQNRTEIHLLIDLNDTDLLVKMLRKWLKNDQNATFIIKEPVEMLYLHGPHFQDRFGIADIAFHALLESDIEILVSGCAGTSMYLVTPANQSRNGAKILSDTFLIPTSV